MEQEYKVTGRSAIFRTVLLILLLVSGTQIYGQITLPKVFSNNMILQRNMDIPVWGVAEPGTQIRVALDKNGAQTTAGQDGKWMVRLPRMAAGGPHTMAVYAGDKQQADIAFENVLIGDVWLASGQSNMEWQVQQSNDADAEIQNADYPMIRFFTVPHNITTTQQTDVLSSAWKICDSVSVKTASAVAYFYARKLHTDLNVPVGILQATWGGTPVEAWTSREQLLASPITRNRIVDHDSITENHFVNDSLDLIRFWDIVYNPQNKTDKTVATKNFDDTKWPTLSMPKVFKDWNMPYYEGMVWLRKTITIAPDMQAKDLSIHLGHPEMNYSLYVNGSEVCKTVWNANPDHYYTLPAGLLKRGANVIAVRMAVLWGGGGFNPPADEMYITDGNTRISLAGEWKYMKDLEPTLPKIDNYHKFPTYLYNGMIKPIVPYGIKGFIWYQGEDNASAATDYQTLFPMLIDDWRIRWQAGYLPFIYVQLANYMAVQPEPSESDWAELREAQTMTLAKPNTAMACIIDIGEAGNIHPKNKQEVGRRLALLAEKMVYNQAVQASGPLYRSVEIKENEIIIQFTETALGLTVRGGGALKGFAVAGSDHQFYWADARIEGDKVVVSSPKVSKPLAVRYAWADNPDGNLTNKEGFPAIPFRTDTWTRP